MLNSEGTRDAPNASVSLPGTPIECRETRDRILKKVRGLCGWKQHSFPGSQPVSLSREYLPLLFRNEYVVCEKTDGVRALLFAASGLVFLIGRMEEVNQIFMRLPVRGNASESQQVTLLDGEVVMDKIVVDGRIEVLPRYMCYDAIYIQRQSLKNFNLLERLTMIYTDVIQPLYAFRRSIKSHEQIDQRSGESLAMDPLEIYMKDFFDITHISHIDEISKLLPHKSDGLIFTPVKLPYVAGTCRSLLKWKPPHLNTVDFSIDVLYDARGFPRLVQLFVMEYGTRVFYNEFLAPYGDVYKYILECALSERITQMVVECSWITDSRIWTFIPNVKSMKSASNNQIQQNTINMNEGKLDYDFDNGVWVQGGWYAKKIRGDKKLPNNINVVESVKSSIEDDITFDMLVQEVNLFKSNGKVPLYNKCILPKFYAAD